MKYSSNGEGGVDEYPAFLKAESYRSDKTITLIYKDKINSYTFYIKGN